MKEFNSAGAFIKYIARYHVMHSSAARP